ncbi:hypothetical protein Ciccas_014489 [Cichlidogyrus casuarinus]|uniref:EF-hand domain-containing protein n=1 Tax=Cichlidogyrus casuarinus TaxID=1844966 RepID=A0ABD2PJP1_9PLAT
MRALTRTGLNRVQLEDISPAMLRTLCNYYEDPEDPEQVLYTRFIEDIDQVFSTPGLHRHPTYRIMPQMDYVRPPKGTGDWRLAGEDLRINCEKGLDKMRKMISERRMLVKPEFRAFDNLNRGHVTMTQFHRLMAMLNMQLPRPQEQAIAIRFADDHGFNYSALLDVIDMSPTKPDEYMYPKLLAERTSNNNCCTDDEITIDWQSLRQHLRDQVHRRRLRMIEFFKDYDKMNHGRLPVETFERALGQTPLLITPEQVAVIETQYQCRSEDRVRMIDWRGFCQDLDPCEEVHDAASSAVTAMTSCEAEEAVRKIASCAKHRGTDICWAFEDFDCAKRQTVSPAQFRRVLTTHGLADCVTEREWLALYRQFRHTLGISDNVHYGRFLKHVNAAA